jgi:hypothetical protein
MACPASARSRSNCSDSNLHLQNPNFVLLYLGDFAPQNSGNVDSFAITPDFDGKGLFVTAYGEFEDIRPPQSITSINDPNTIILAFGNPNISSSATAQVTVENGVHAHAYIVGGSNINSFNYQGDGDTYLQGGAATDYLLPQTTQNTLIGGDGINYLVGGGLAALPPAYSQLADWNVLIGGTGQNSQNVLQAGDAGATLVAGPNKDTLTAGNPAQQQSDYVLRAGKGKGSDRLVGGGPNAFTEFDWNEQDGSVDVTGGANKAFSPQFPGSAGNIFNVTAATPDQTWHLQQDNNNGDLVIPVDNTRTIRARQLQVLNLDDSPAVGNANPPPQVTYPLGTQINYQVDDLSLTGIDLVQLNLHEQDNPDVYQDHVVINAPNVPDMVDVVANRNITGHGPITVVNIATQNIGPTGLPSSYYVQLAIPKAKDTLNVNTSNGNDQVVIHSTQSDVDGLSAGGHVFVNTGGGDDQITVGDYNDGLDSFLGSLDVDAGTGHNAITFDERGSFIQDTVTLTASQLIRYLTFQTSGNPGHPAETASPFIINYKVDPGGDFANGVLFKTTKASTNLYIPETGANAPLTVQADGGVNNSHDNIYVGYDGAFPSNPQQHTIYGGIPISLFPTSVSNSTLDLLRSPINVHGVTQSPGTPPVTYLEIDDEGVAISETYLLGIPAMPIGDFLQRSGTSEIAFDQTAMVLNAGNHGNQIIAQGVFNGNAATINAGTNDQVTVSDPNHTLQGIQGPLDVVGIGANDKLTLDDTKGFLNFAYFLKPIEVDVASVRVGYNHLASLMLKGSGGFDSYQVQGTVSGTQYQIIGSGLGNSLQGSNSPSIWNILAANAGKLNANLVFSSIQSLLGNSSPDVFAVHTGGSLAGSIDGGTGTNTLDYSSYGTGVTVNLPAGTATGVGGSVMNIENVNGSPHNDTIIGIPGSVIRGNGGLDTLSGGPNDTFIMAANQLAGTSVTGAGIGNTLVGANITNGWLLTGPGSGTLTGGITFSGIANLTGGTGTDIFKFTPAGSVAGKIDGAGGSNTLDYSLFGGPTGVNLQTSTATGTGGFLHFGSLAGAGTLADTLIGPKASSTWTLTGAGAGTVGSFHFSAIANLTGGPGADTFKFMPGGSVAGTIDGGGGSNKLDYSGIGGPIAMTLTGPASGTASGTGGFANIQTLVGSGNSLDTLTGPNTNNIWNITNPNAGNINSTFNFSKIANLVGGTGVDVFKIATAGSISGNISGGPPPGQGDWLDYSANTNLITVNLALGSATGVTGTVSNIQNVLGGNGGDILTGDAQGNILIGGSGNNQITGGSGASLLIAGKGKSLVTGGSGGDLLIGGYTTYDQTHNLAALASILAEWQSTDSYATRVTAIKTGSGGLDLNGSNTLVLGTTVKDPGSFDTLTGGPGFIPGTLEDWFFKGIHDTINNYESGPPAEQIN